MFWHAASRLCLPPSALSASSWSLVSSVQIKCNKNSEDTEIEELAKMYRKSGTHSSTIIPITEWGLQAETIKYTLQHYLIHHHHCHR